MVHVFGLKIKFSFQLIQFESGASKSKRKSPIGEASSSAKVGKTQQLDPVAGAFHFCNVGGDAVGIEKSSSEAVQESDVGKVGLASASRKAPQPVDREKIQEIAMANAVKHDGKCYVFVCERPKEWHRPDTVAADAILSGCSFCIQYEGHLKKVQKRRGTKWSRCEVVVSQPSCVRNHAKTPHHKKAIEHFFISSLGVQVELSDDGNAETDGFPGKVPQPEDYLRTFVSTIVGDSNYSHERHVELDWLGFKLSGVRTKNDKKRWCLSEAERQESRDFVEAAVEISIMADEKAAADAVAFTATNDQLVTKTGILGVLENLEIDKTYVEMGSDERAFQKYTLGLESCVKNFAYEGRCSLASHKAPGFLRSGVKRSLDENLSTVALDGAPSAQKAGRTFCGRNGIPLVIRDLTHLFNKHSESVADCEPRIQTLRKHLFLKHHGFLKETMYSNRLQQKLAGAQFIIIKHADHMLSRILLSYSHSSVRHSGEVDALANHCVTLLACTLVNADEASDEKRSLPDRTCSLETLDAVYFDNAMCIFSGLWTDFMVLWHIIVHWSDRTVRDLSKTDWLLLKFKDAVGAVFVNGSCFANWEDCNKGMFVHIVMRQLMMKRKFWVGNQLRSHHNPDDPDNTKAAKEALGSLRVVIGGLFQLIDAGLDLKFLENAFRVFHLERWMRVQEFLDRGSAASKDDKNWAEATKAEFEACHSLICKARGWPITWFAFQSVVDVCVEEWRRERPSGYDEFEFHDPRHEKNKMDSDELMLQCWRLGVARAVGQNPGLEPERKKVIWYLNLCATGTSGNERILKQVASVWKTRSSFLSRQSLEDSVVLKCGQKDVAQWVHMPEPIEPSGVKHITKKHKLKGTLKLKKADRFWRKTFGERYVLHRKVSLTKREKSKTSKRAIKAMQIKSLCQIVARFKRSKKEKKLKAMQQEQSIFGVKMKYFMGDDDLTERVKNCPAMQACIDSFKKRHTYKEKEQERRALGHNAYQAEAKQGFPPLGRRRKSEAEVEKLRKKTNTDSEVTYWKLPVGSDHFAAIPASIASHWKEVKLTSNADVIVVKNLDFCIVSPTSTDVPDALINAMIFGKRIVLPEYLLHGGNKDANNTSIKFVGGVQKRRGIILTDRFKSKHRYFTSVIQKACALDSGKGWEVINDGDKEAWEKAENPVSTIDQHHELVELLKADSHPDRKRSAKGKYQI